MAQWVKTLPAMQETWVQSLGGEDPLEKEMASTRVFLPGKPHGRRNQAAAAHEVEKESDMTEHARTK